MLKFSKIGKINKSIKNLNWIKSKIIPQKKILNEKSKQIKIFFRFFCRLLKLFIVILNIINLYMSYFANIYFLIIFVTEKIKKNVTKNDKKKLIVFKGT